MAYVVKCDVNKTLEDYLNCVARMIVISNGGKEKRNYILCIQSETI